MKPEKLFVELEEIVEQLGYKVRKERGSFRGGFCVVSGTKLVMINKNHPADIQAGFLAKFLRDQNLEDIFVKPATRKELENKWAEFQLSEQKNSDLFTTEDE